MDEAQALFREGVEALKQGGDAARARRLITQSLRLNPNNEMAWLWLSRTTDSPAQKLQCVERALKINPNNAQALALRRTLTGEGSPPSMNAREEAEAHHDSPPAAAPPVEMRARTQRDALAPDEERRIEAHLRAADARLAADDAEGAVEEWVHALQIQVDHPQAIQRAVRQLHAMKFTADAQELLERAIAAGTPSTAIYLTAIDVHKFLGNFTRANALREQIIAMDVLDDAGILRIIDGLLSEVQTARALELLESAIALRPNSADLLIRMGSLLEDQGRRPAALGYYERAARAGRKGRHRAAPVVEVATPVITDSERGSVILALREALGFTAAALVMAWQDAGLNLLRLTPNHWLGVGLSLVGGYCVVTAFSSPQQKGLAAALGGRVPPKPEGGRYTHEIRIKPWEDASALPSGPLQDLTALPILPDWARLAFAVVGFAVLAAAFALVFQNAVQLLINPVPPVIPSVLDFITER